MSKRICICSAQVPFARGGAEVLVETLATELREHGHEVEVVRLPFSWSSRTQLFKSALAWRLLDLSQAEGRNIDLVIATRFPAYLVKHTNKVVWLVHQYRQAYELRGSRFSELHDEPRDRAVVEMIRAMDIRALSEARGLFAISRNTARRLRRFNGLEAEPLYPPPKLGSAYSCKEYGDYIFAAGRLDGMKRFDLLIRAMQNVRSPIRCLIAGKGPDQEALQSLIAELGLEQKVKLLGWVADDELVEHYARCLAVYYAPYDEDYGYVTLEAFKSAKPVITMADAGGVLEFVEDGNNGVICSAGSWREIATRINALARDPSRARTLGQAGRQRVENVGWEQVLSRLTATLPRD